jgi:hypothetical protein
MKAHIGTSTRISTRRKVLKAFQEGAAVRLYVAEGERHNMSKS